MRMQGAGTRRGLRHRGTGVAQSLSRAVGVALVTWAATTHAFAQAADAWPRSLEVTVGGIWSDGYPLGSSSATLTRNERNPTTRFTLFATETGLQDAAGFDVRVGVHLTSMLALETGLIFTKPRAVATISGDGEGAPVASVEEQLSQYIVDVSLLVHLTRYAFGNGRGLPFVSAGGGYLRQLHEGDTLGENGQVYHIGGGVKYLLLTGQGWLSGLGVRADVRAYLRDGGFDLEDKRRTFGAVGGSLVVLF